jgi:predicted transposase YdaD
VSKPYDATTKDLLEIAPADWLAFLGHPAPERVRLIDADLSTVTTAADKVLLVEEDPPWLLHLEFQSRHEEKLPQRILRYNVLLAERHGLPVSSAVILLRSKASVKGLTGWYRDPSRLDGREHSFPYHVSRVWRQPVDTILAGGLATLPLAPLAHVRRPELPGILQRMRERVAAEAPEEKRKTIWAATYVLMGLRYPEALADQLLQGVLGMEESVTYQAIIRKGEARGEARGEVTATRRHVLRAGRSKFGEPDASTQAAIEAIADRERLERLFNRIFEVASWKELLAPPGQ